MSRTLFLVLCVILATIACGECGGRRQQQQQGGADAGNEGSCRYWCRQKGTRDVKYYCCENDAQNSGRDKNRMCPPERAVCPQRQAVGKGPNECKKDAECKGTEMCCMDVCLKHRTCKPSQVSTRPKN